MNITGYDLVLCAAALEEAAKVLEEGCESAVRMNIQLPPNVKSTSEDMLTLLAKIHDALTQHKEANDIENPHSSCPSL